MAESLVHRSISSRDGGQDAAAHGLYVKAVPPPDLNKNTSWLELPGIWTTYILILFISWLLILSVFGCSAGVAWTAVNLIHFAVTYKFFHWEKGTPFSEDQGMYNKKTWWEQIDNGRQLTRSRKFLTVVPIVLYLIASHTTDYKNPILFLNTIAMLVLVVAKFPYMHKPTLSILMSLYRDVLLFTPLASIFFACLLYMSTISVNVKFTRVVGG